MRTSHARSAAEDKRASTSFFAAEKSEKQKERMTCFGDVFGRSLAVFWGPFFWNLKKIDVFLLFGVAYLPKKSFKKDVS